MIRNAVARSRMVITIRKESRIRMGTCVCAGQRVNAQCGEKINPIAQRCNRVTSMLCHPSNAAHSRRVPSIRTARYLVSMLRKWINSMSNQLVKRGTTEETLWARTIRFLKIYWMALFTVFWPIFLTTLLLCYNTRVTRCAFVVLLMAGFWVTECVPMGVTSLIPVVLFPAFGILSTADACSCYMNDTIMVFIGGLILASAIEHSNLHLRIALGVMKSVGCSHAKLLGGLCAVTTFLSMWVSNTAASAMMVPIIFAVLYELEQAGIGQVYVEQSTDPENPENPENSEIEKENRPSRLTLGYLMATAYCATCGGTGTLVGTGTNLAFKGIYESMFPAAENISFTLWMVASAPHMTINCVLTWLYIRVAYMGFLRPNSKDAEMAGIGAEGEEITNRVILQRYKDLGKITFHEKAVTFLFFVCIFLWVFRKPGFVIGWSELITEIDVRDSTPVILVSILMFFIPRDPRFIYACSKNPSLRPSRCSEGLISWSVIQRKLPWSLVLLLGGGFAISKGSVASCLAYKVGQYLLPLRTLPPILIMTVVCLFTGLLTEFTSNVGTANLTLPVVAQMCVAMKIHPLYLMVPAALSCSFAFRLPVGTPPNAIVTVAGNIPTRSLIAGGCVPSIYSAIVIIIVFSTWGQIIFGINEFPDWASNLEASESGPTCA